MRVQCGFTFAVVADTGVLLSVRVTSGILQGLSLTLRITRGEHTHFTIQPHDEVSEVLLRSCPRLRRDLQFALFAENRRLSRCGRSHLFRQSRWWTSLAGLLRSAASHLAADASRADRYRAALVAQELRGDGWFRVDIPSHRMARTTNGGEWQR